MSVRADDVLRQVEGEVIEAVQAVVRRGLVRREWRDGDWLPMADGRVAAGERSMLAWAIVADVLLDLSDRDRALAVRALDDVLAPRSVEEACLSPST